MGTSAFEVLSAFYKDYKTNTPQKIKIIDAYLLYILLTGINQFLYCCLVGTFPFNSFLSGFISCVASFVLGVCLRLQVNPQNTSHKCEMSRVSKNLLQMNLYMRFQVCNKYV
ncbi:dolichyl-diphosphooligosaccharide--protein glycosyltransferase subunit DAD1 [Trichonephila clavata]|uniref:Dolichyl-diphosphooligosaccharide--protein glycosyltransferase subunit DAD1 n=1 Tax=Trichonephila clavata TaxID=2740835 RepID=A0A8X6G288_TRICU|nr:dolichyl-diphosphooligosaccharide--protein glycosyltransferase subunit DAD1 [Trichonephila clavata]